MFASLRNHKDISKALFRCYCCCSPADNIQPLGEGHVANLIFPPQFNPRASDRQPHSKSSVICAEKEPLFSSSPLSLTFLVETKSSGCSTGKHLVAALQHQLCACVFRWEGRRTFSYVVVLLVNFFVCLLCPFAELLK